MNYPQLTSNCISYEMKCIASYESGSEGDWFTIGKTYKTTIADFDFVGAGCPQIVDDQGTGWYLNWQSGRVYGVEGTKIIAKFELVRDSRRRYYKHMTTLGMKQRKSGVIDYRSARRYLRNVNKFSPHKAVARVARNAGK